MSLIYNRKVEIHRPNPQTGVGEQPYGAVTKGNERLVLKDLPASIQQDRERGRTESGSPTSAPSATGWNIFIPKRGVTRGQITERDVVVDDMAKRYVVMAAYWNFFGYKLVVELLQA